MPGGKWIRENRAKQDIAVLHSKRVLGSAQGKPKQRQVGRLLGVQGCCSGLAGVAGECPAVTAALGSAI